LRLAIDLRTLLWIGVLAALIVFRGPVFLSLLPFVIGLVLANLIEPIVGFFERWGRLPRGVAAALALALVVGVVGYAGTWLATELTRELIQLSRLLPAHQDAAVELFNTFLAWGQRMFQELPAEVQAYLQQAAQNVARSGTELAAAAVDRVLDAVAAVPTISLVLALAVVATFFFAKDRYVVHSVLVQALPARVREVAAEAQDKILRDLASFFRAYFILFLISAALAATGLLFAQTRYWIVLSVVLAILDSIPMVGPALVLLPWAGYALYMGAVGQAVVLAVTCAVMFVVRQVLQPKLLGDSVGVHPLLMLLALWAGLVTVGVWGVIVGPAAVIALKAAHKAGVFSQAWWPAGGGKKAADGRSERPVAAAAAVQPAFAPAASGNEPSGFPAAATPAGESGEAARSSRAAAPAGEGGEAARSPEAAVAGE